VANTYQGDVRPTQQSGSAKEAGFTRVASGEAPFTAQLPELAVDATLEAQVRAYANTLPPSLALHFYYLNLGTGATVQLAADTPVAAASVIKLPVLHRYLTALAEGQWTPQTPLTYGVLHQAAGSGGLQYQPPNQVLSSLDVATQMIQTSDNSATNILIDAFGGAQQLQADWQPLGLEATHLRNWLPDLEGTNTLSVREMAAFLYDMQLSPRFPAQVRALATQMLTGVRNRRLIVAGVGPEATVAHKTGDIGTSLGDAALVTLPDGRGQYLLCIQVARPYNHGSAKAAIVELSRLVYAHVVAGAPPAMLAGSGAVASVLPRQAHVHTPQQ
jgi:beta-lactamase class A